MLGFISIFKTEKDREKERKMKFGEGSRNKQNSKAPEGNVLCYCGLSGKIYQAWIDKNPGQRSYGCERYKVQNNCESCIYYYGVP